MLFPEKTVILGGVTHLHLDGATMSFFSTAHAANTATHQSGQSMSSTLIFIAIMFAAIYFFIIRPQTKRAKQQKNMQEAIKMGDNIMTIGGILGKVTKLRGDNLVIEISENTELTIKRSAVAQILGQESIDTQNAEQTDNPNENNNDNSSTKNQDDAEHNKKDENQQ